MQDTLFGNYAIEKFIGHGGMGRVYLAKHVLLETYAAVKVIEPAFQDNPDYLKRFKREAKSVFRLKHPNIVDFYEFGVVNNLYYMAVEYVDGVDLKTLLQEYKRRREDVPLEEVIRIAEQLASALDYIHSKGVIHRDIKPSNILLDEKGGIILTDFGIALNVVEQTIGTAFGSVYYCSPEQIISPTGAVPQSDVYSLGVLIYEMLTRKVPFDGDTPWAIARKIIQEPPPSLRELKPELPQAFEQFVTKALAKNQHERYQTAASLLADLRKASEQIEITLSLETMRTPVPINAVLAGLSQKSARTSPQLDKPWLPGNKLAVTSDKKELPYKGPLLGWSRKRWKAILLAGLFGMLCALTTVIYIRLVELPNNLTAPTSEIVDGEYSFAQVLERKDTSDEAQLKSVQENSTQPTTAQPSNSQKPEPNIQIINTNAAVTVINIGNTKTSLKGVTFIRISEDGKPTASFSAATWDYVAGKSVSEMPAGDCYQLLLIEKKANKPEVCRILQGWIASSKPEWHFWIAGKDSQIFQVIQNGKLIHICQISEDSCTFYLPTP